MFEKLWTFRERSALDAYPRAQRAVTAFVMGLFATLASIAGTVLVVQGQVAAGAIVLGIAALCAFLTYTSGVKGKV